MIGVFDSGLGGLTALCELVKLLPGEDFVYFGDTGRVPYGSKSADTVIRYSTEIMRFLSGFGIDAALVACGTASSAALPTLRREFPIPVFGVIDAAAAAAAATTPSRLMERNVTETSPLAVIFGASPLPPAYKAARRWRRSFCS